MHLRLGHREVEEAILAAVHAMGWVLRGDAATTTSHEASETAHHARIRPQLLVVPVTCHQEVESVGMMQHAEKAGICATREVCDDDLPIGPGGCQLRLKPTFLLVVALPEPVLAAVERGGPAPGSASGSIGSVHLAADVVLRIIIWTLGIKSIGVDHEILNGETRVVHHPAVVAAWHHPIPVHEGIPNLLGPTVVELPATIVVVPEAADPRLVSEAAINALPSLGKVLERQTVGMCAAAILLHATPIEVVTDIEHVLGIADACTLFHDICHQDLRAIVDPADVPTILRALLARATLVWRRVMPRKRGTPIADGKDVCEAIAISLNLELPLILQPIVLGGDRRSTAAAEGRRVVPQARRQQGAQRLGSRLCLCIRAEQALGLGLSLGFRGSKLQRLLLLLCAGTAAHPLTTTLQSVQGAIHTIF
mmetsp:Transcript_118033/g.296783  ORF Transcript_118033/g.296783 Transcript_118033/m.296783 type:complete len:423 (+) Transcript_118033:212-1480(+)